MWIFDCNCSFGPDVKPAFRYARNPEELLAEMDFCGIDRALVYHAGQRSASPTVHNPRLLGQVADHGRLEGTWTILPPQTAEQPAAQPLLQDMTDRGIRALRAFPDEHRYRLDGRTFGDLLDALAQRRIPLLVKLNASSLGELMSEFPRLTAVAVNQGPHSLERYLRPLVETYSNLHIETSCYMVEGLIEEFCERYGPRRLLFGSGFPDNCSGAALLRLAQAEIDPEQKKMIAGENLRRLLEGAGL